MQSAGSLCLNSIVFRNWCRCARLVFDYATVHALHVPQAMSVQLVDSKPGDGGFCIVPGTHKVCR